MSHGQNNRNSYQHNTRAPPGNFRPSGQRAYTAAPNESAQFLTEPASNEPKSGAEPNAPNSIGYWIEPPTAEDSYGPIPKGHYEADLYNEMDPPDTTAYFTTVDAIPQFSQQNAQLRPRKTPITSQKAPIASYSSRARNYRRVSPSLLHDCRKCEESFSSRTKLFNHLELCLYSDTDEESPATAQSASVATKPT